MKPPQIDVQIRETCDGPYYEVRLHSIPRIGELIVLFSFVDMNSGHPPKKHYEVVQVVHDLHDVSEKIPQAKEGVHSVTVFVKPFQSPFLKP